jgi:hypothetical protein
VTALYVVCLPACTRLVLSTPNTTGVAHTPTAPSEQTHPQNSRFTPRCPSVVLWSPCSGVEWRVKDDVASVEEWRVFEPTIRVWRSGNDAQAAYEPGGGGSGGVPVHPARLHTHRTSPAQALLTILTETCCNV